jgi:hypothetical protein
VAVGRIHVPVHLFVLMPERVEPTELLPDCEDDAVRERRDGEDAEDGEERKQAELAYPAPTPVWAPRLRAMSVQQHGRGGILASVLA